MGKYKSASDSLRPGQLDRLVSKIKDFNPLETCGNCYHRLGEECTNDCGKEIYLDNTCDDWEGIP